MSGEKVSNESITDHEKNYKVMIYHLYDQAITSFEKWFIYDALYQNMYYVDPNNFSTLENASHSILRIDKLSSD
jgi:hypothetical protein